MTITANAQVCQCRRNLVSELNPVIIDFFIVTFSVGTSWWDWSSTLCFKIQLTVNFFNKRILLVYGVYFNYTGDNLVIRNNIPYWYDGLATTTNFSSVNKTTSTAEKALMRPRRSCWVLIKRHWYEERQSYVSKLGPTTKRGDWWYACWCEQLYLLVTDPRRYVIRKKTRSSLTSSFAVLVDITVAQLSSRWFNFSTERRTGWLDSGWLFY